MRRYSLLEMVQEVSRQIGDKERFGLDEDMRVQDVANVCVSTLEGLCSRRTWEFLRDRVIAPTAVTSNVTISIPANVVRVNQVKYLVNTTQTDLCYLLPEIFLAQVNTSSDFTEAVVVPGGATIYVKNNSAPRYYTSFDEQTLTFDAYDISVDAGGIVASKVVMRAEIELDTAGAHLAGLPVDTWVPDIPTRMFQLWYWESVQNCYATIVGMQDQTSMREARRHYVKLLDLEPKTQRDEDHRSVNSGRRYNY